MLRTLSTAALAVMLLAVLATSALAQSAGGAAPAASGDPEAGDLLRAAGFAFSQPDPAQKTYRVTVESGGQVAIVIVSQFEASWKYADGSAVKGVQYWSSVSPTYTQDVVPSAAMLRKLAEFNDAHWFGYLSIFTDQMTGEWSIWANFHQFLRGATPDTLADHLFIVGSVATDAKSQIVPLVQP